MIRKTGIPKDTPYTWRNKARKGGDVPTLTIVPRELSSDEKFNIVLETASLNEMELGAYCRRKGIFKHMIEAWRETCKQAHTVLAPKAKADRSNTCPEKGDQTPGNGIKTEGKSPGRGRSFIDSPKKSPVSLGGARGRKIDHAERLKVVELIKEASTVGARQSKACEVVGISLRTLQRWDDGDRVLVDGRGAAAQGRQPMFSSKTGFSMRFVLSVIL